MEACEVQEESTMTINHVSEAVIRRLPGYYRHLKELEAEGIKQISSQELGARMKQTPRKSGRTSITLADLAARALAIALPT